MKSIDFMHESLNPKHAIDVHKFNREFRKNHPDYFDPDGLLVACGRQGSGKTLTVVNYIIQLAKYYPKMVLVTNVTINGLPDSIKVIPFTNLNQLITFFEIVNNGEYGVVYLVDEIQVLFNALLKRGQSVQVLEVISQQRKQRKHIVGTAQVFMKIDKVFREQMNNVILCKNFFGCFQYNQIVDGSEISEESGKPDFDKIKARRFWFHSPDMYKRYDTSAIISAYRQEYENVQMTDETYQNLLNYVKGVTENGD